MFDDKRQLTWRKLKVGLVVTGAIALLFLAVLFAGNIQELFVSRTTIHALFDDVKGLRSGAPVWIAGIQIGSVHSLEFTPSEKIKVTMLIDRSALPYIKQNSRASVLTLGLLGDMYVEISPGTGEAARIKPGEAIRGASQPGINEQVEGIISRLKDRKGTLGRLLEEDAVYNDLADALRDIKRVVAKVEESKGSMNSFISDNRLYENVNTTVVKLNSILDKLNTGEGAAGSLISNKELKQELHSTLREINSLVKDIKQNPKKYFSFSVF